MFTRLWSSMRSLLAARPPAASASRAHEPASDVLIDDDTLAVREVLRASGVTLPVIDSPEYTALGAPGALGPIAVTTSQQHGWRSCANLVFLACDGRRWLWLPRRRGEGRSVTLGTLPAMPWPDGPDPNARFAALTAITDAIRKPHASPALGAAEDLAPRLLPTLHALIRADNPDAFAPALAVLDRLAAVTGAGRDEVAPSSITVGARALANALLRARIDENQLPRCIRDASRYGDGARDRAGHHRVFALSERDERIDGQSGGRTTEVAALHLAVSETSLRFERRVLRYTRKDGIELS